MKFHEPQVISSYPDLIEGLSNRQKSVLAAMAWWGPNWIRPLDIGGRDGSRHSRVLNELVRKGFVECRQRSGYRATRGSKVYRLTAKGGPAAVQADLENTDRLLDCMQKLTP